MRSHLQTIDGVVTDHTKVIGTLGNLTQSILKKTGLKVKADLAEAPFSASIYLVQEKEDRIASLESKMERLLDRVE